MSAYEITAKDGDPRDIMNGLSIAVSYARQHKLPYAFLTDKMLEETVDVQRMEQMLPEALEKRNGCITSPLWIHLASASVPTI